MQHCTEGTQTILRYSFLCPKICGTPLLIRHYLALPFANFFNLQYLKFLRFFLIIGREQKGNFHHVVTEEDQEQIRGDVVPRHWRRNS
jgi:hypothetical protein